MVKANELRIGNLTMQGVVAEIDNHCFRVLNENKESLKSTWFEIEPIPLTEDWMLKFGAEVNEFDNGQSNQYRIKDDLFVIRDGIICHYGTSVKLEYVHELQNLFFALRKKELEMKGGNNE